MNKLSNERKLIVVLKCDCFLAAALSALAPSSLCQYRCAGAGRMPGTPSPAARPGRVFGAPGQGCRRCPRTRPRLRAPGAAQLERQQDASGQGGAGPALAPGRLGSGLDHAAAGPRGSPASSCPWTAWWSRLLGHPGWREHPGGEWCAGPCLAPHTTCFVPHPQEPWTPPLASGTLLPQAPASHCPLWPDTLAAVSDGALASVLAAQCLSAPLVGS